MRATATGWTVEIPAGEYFLGDPCYAVPDDLWDEALESCDYFQGGPVATVTAKDGNTYNIVGFNTAYGDGEYLDQDGTSYSVDAGMIGLTPLPLIETDPRYTDEEYRRLGRFVHFALPVKATTDGKGDLSFGSYQIDTGDESY